MNYRHEWKHEITWSDLIALRQRLGAVAYPDEHAVEGVEDAFLQRNYSSDYGELYKPDSLFFGGGRGNGQMPDGQQMPSGDRSRDGSRTPPGGGSP